MAQVLRSLKKLSLPRHTDLTAAMERLMKVLAKTHEHNAAPTASAAPLPAADAALMKAVEQGDIKGITSTVAQGADVNCDMGLPLQLAARRNDAQAMKELVILGAEVVTAASSLQKKRDTLAMRRQPLQVRAQNPEVREAVQGLMETVTPPGPKYRVSDKDILQLLTEIDKQGGGMLSSQGDAEYQGVQQALNTLQAWERQFLQSIAPVESLRMQRKILDALADLKEELSQKSLDKPRLSPPRKSEPPQPT